MDLAMEPPIPSRPSHLSYLASSLAILPTDMASEEAMTTGSAMQQDVVDYLLHSSTAVDADDDMYHGDGSEADVDDDHMGLRMPRLSIQSTESDASAEIMSDGKKKKKSTSDDDDDDDDDGVITYEYLNGDLSLPASPARSSPSQRPKSSRPVWLKGYASETEAGPAPECRAQKRRSGGGDRTSSYYWRSSRRARESRLERTWEMRRCHCTGDGADSHSGGSSPCVVVRQRGRGAACMCMDMDEVRACRDLGLELPCDWTVEIPPAAFHAATPPRDTSSGGDSPVGSWRISSTGQDPRDVKARLRVWAQAVALASASRLGS